MIDSTIIRAHQHAAGSFGGQKNESLGRSRGGFSTKIHVKVDKLGRPINITLTGGQVHDIKQADKLLNNEKCDNLLADKGYDSYKFRNHLKKKNINPVIPGRKNRTLTIQYNKECYKNRNIIERFFNRLKQFRKIATRYEKTACMFMGNLVFACIFILIKS